MKPLPWISEKCANRSLPPASGVMKPKPFESLNHFTVPVSMLDSSISFSHRQKRRQGMTIKEDTRRKSGAVWASTWTSRLLLERSCTDPCTRQPLPCQSTSPDRW
ncbi:hypothetical protein CBM2637_B100193 [Cupriavidus taiwanensis]|nr:hypothetical protein CBM2637_B100193 [Cupriavidus taiwanensis]